jgi:hypothetical protein
MSAGGGEVSPESLRREIARLEGRVAALEDALDRRSRELRLLQSALCPRDLVQLARIADGLPPLPLVAHQPEYWTETTVISPAELESTLEDLWLSLTPSPARSAIPMQTGASPWSSADDDPFSAESAGRGNDSE